MNSFEKYLLLIYGLVKVNSVSLVVIVPLIFASKSTGIEYSFIKSVEYMPYLFVGLLVGFLLDKFSSKILLSLIILVQVSSSLAIYLSVSVCESETLSYLGVFLVSACGISVINSVNYLANNVISNDRFVKFNSDIATIYTLADFMVPLAIAIAYTKIGVEVILFSAVIPLIALIIVSKVKLKIPVNLEKTKNISFNRSINNFFGNRNLVSLCLIVMLVNAVEIIPGTLMAYHALNYLDVSNYQLSILFMACSLGGIVGSFIGKNIENNNKHLVFVLIGTMFINGLLYLTIWSYNSYFLFLICIFLEHISIILSALAFRTMRQNFSKKDSFGSVLGISGVFVKILVPVSILSGGLIIKYSNSSYIFLVSGIVELVIILPVSLIIINKILKNRSEDDELKYIIN